jgi:hypothetical protein
MKPGNELAVVGLCLSARLPWFRRSFSPSTYPTPRNFLGASLGAKHCRQLGWSSLSATGRSWRKSRARYK